MKRITQSLLGLFGIALVFMACQKGDTAPDTPAISISADFNGSPWSTSTFGGATMQYDTVHGTQKLVFGGGFKRSATDTTYEGITLAVDSFMGVGTYKVSNANTTVNAWYVLGTAFHEATAGQIVITSYSTKQVSGSFHFKTDAVTVTSGLFNLHVQ